MLTHHETRSEVLDTLETLRPRTTLVVLIGFPGWGESNLLRRFQALCHEAGHEPAVLFEDLHRLEDEERLALLEPIRSGRIPWALATAERSGLETGCETVEIRIPPLSREEILEECALWSVDPHVLGGVERVISITGGWPRLVRARILESLGDLAGAAALRRGFREGLPVRSREVLVQVAAWPQPVPRAFLDDRGLEVDGLVERGVLREEAEGVRALETGLVGVAAGADEIAIESVLEDDRLPLSWRVRYARSRGAVESVVGRVESWLVRTGLETSREARDMVADLPEAAIAPGSAIARVRRLEGLERGQGQAPDPADDSPEGIASRLAHARGRASRGEVVDPSTLEALHTASLRSEDLEIRAAVLDLMVRVSEGPDRLEDLDARLPAAGPGEAVRLQMTRARILMAGRRFREASAALEVCERGHGLGDEWLEAECALLVARCRAAQGDLDEALRRLAIGPRPRRRDEDAAVRTDRVLLMAELEVMDGRAREARDRLEAFVAQASDQIPPRLRDRIDRLQGMVFRALGDYREARRALERGLAGPLRTGRFPTDGVLDAGATYIEVLRELGALNPARPLLQQMSDGEAIPAERGLHAVLDGEVETALETWESGLERARSEEDVAGRLKLLGSLARVHMRLGNMVYARLHAQESREIAEARGGAPARARALDLEAEIAVENGDPRAALRALEEARRLKVEQGDVRGVVATDWARGRMLRRAGEATEARRVLEEALGTCQKHGFKMQEFRCLIALIGAFQDMGHMRDARSQLRRVERLARDLELRETSLLHHLARIATGPGRDAGAVSIEGLREEERAWLSRFAQQQGVGGPAVDCVTSGTGSSRVSRVEVALASPSDYDLVVDETTRETWFGGERAEKMSKSPQIHSLLVALMRAGSEGMTKEQLVRRLWNLEYDPEIHKTKVHVAILRLRRSLGVTKPGEDRDPITFDPDHATYAIHPRFRYFLKAAPAA